MKIHTLSALLVLFLVACTSSPTTPGTLPPPTVTNAPAITVNPLPTATTIRTQAELATAPATAAVSAPTMRERIMLRDLVGIGRHPYALVALGNKIYALNIETENLALIQNERIVKFIPAGRRPSALIADPTQNRLYIASSNEHTVSIVVNDQISITQNIGEDPATILFQENRLFVGLSTSGTIWVLDPGTLQIQTRLTIPGVYGIINLAGDPTHHRIYASLYDKTAVIDSTNLRVLKTIATEGNYYTLAAFPSKDGLLTTIYESAGNAEYLVAFDPTSGAERARAKIGGDPRSIVLNTDGSRAYIACSFSNFISVVDTNSFATVATIPVDLKPYALALDETAHRLYVGNYDSDSINVVNTDTNQVVATLPLGILPTALETNDKTGRVYVASASTDSVFVIEGTRIIKEVPVGRHPIDLSRDTQNNRVFVANAADNTLSIIDESNFGVRATQPITRFLTTVAVDNPRSRVFAGDVILDINTLTPVGQLTMRGFTVGSVITPDFIRINQNVNRIYAFGGNGVPGSNGRRVTYGIDANTLEQRGILSTPGNNDQFALDPETNRVFIAGTHPMALTNEMSVFDANDAKVNARILKARTAGMAYNPQTHHLFLSQVTSYSRTFGPTPTPADNSILILDATTFGEVGSLTVNTPGKMVRLGNMIYVANREDGSVTLIEDANVPPPPAPTATLTPTPYPTLTPSPRTPTPITRATATQPRVVTTQTCAIPIISIALQHWTPDMANRLGCPVEGERLVNFAMQPFQNGTMFWREDNHKITVLLNDKTWSEFDDTWTSTMSEDSCPNTSIANQFIKPKRGFGKVWCEQTALRTKLGAATGNEFGTYAAPTQRFERGQIFGGASGQVFVLSKDGKWE